MFETQLQQTVSSEASLTGVGLHTGKPVTLTVKPAPAGSGITFQRLDLPGEPKVRASLQTVDEAPRGTRLKIGDDHVYTVEHFLAACVAAGVDNALVAMDGPEPPATDGSAREFLALLGTAGITAQDKPRVVWRVKTPCSFTDEHGSISVVPADEFKVSYTLQYANPVIGYQIKTFTFDRQVFAADYSPARTFCLRSEVEALQRANLAMGGSLANAVVVDEHRVLNEGGLRFPDEFVRHKILDLLGDLCLQGLPIKGHFIAVRSGHFHNVKLLKELARTRGIVAESDSTVFDVLRIAEILPHRFPFLLVDRILHMDVGKTAVGLKNVTINEPFFPGHYPGRPVMPGVLIIEALAQVAGVCILSMPEHRGRMPFFTGLDGIKFRRPVVPGDQLKLEVEVQKIKGQVGHVAGRALVEDKVAAEGILKFTLA